MGVKNVVFVKAILEVVATAVDDGNADVVPVDGNIDAVTNGADFCKAFAFISFSKSDGDCIFS